MPGYDRLLVTGLLILLPIAALFGQDRAELEKKRRTLEKQIRETNELLNRSMQQRSASVATLQTLKSEIAMREELVRSLTNELDLLNSDVKKHERSLSELESTITLLKENYSRQVRQEYFERQMDHPVLYLLSARTLNEMFLRWSYRRQIQQARKRTLEDLRNVMSEIYIELKSLAALREQKQEISKDVTSQESELKASASQAAAMVSELEKKERSLKQQLEKQKKESEALSAEIEKIIAAEVKKSAESANLPSAPALLALSTEFARNKGKLPWPVERGAITSKFGTQPHPVVKSITISNNGVDITAPPSSAVKAIFGGKVVGRKFIPGYDHMVIIQHGQYYSVYSRLADVNVQLNDEVDVNDVIGRLSGDKQENPRLHLEIWENKVQLNPEQWISR